MAELYTSTVKYIYLAIQEYLPIIEQRFIDSSSGVIQRELGNTLEMYQDIAKKISVYHLNFTDPNRDYDGEPREIELNVNEKVTEHLARLTLRLLEKWKKDVAYLKNKIYITEQNETELARLERLIWPLDAFINAPGYVLNKYIAKGPLVFPGETDKEKKEEKEPAYDGYTPLFSRSLVELLPGDIKTLCEEFDFNYKNKKPNACMLLLRKILPLAIVRKFQQIDKEEEIKLNGEYLGTQNLLGKANGIMSSPRIYDEISSFKFLIDSSQHIFTITTYLEDISRPATALRIMVEDFFKKS